MRRALLLLPLALAGCAAPSVVTPPPVPIPAELRTLAQEIAARPRLSTFAAELAASGDARAGAAGPVTVFAAADDAYARLAPGVADALLGPENRDVLRRFVAFHLVEGRWDAAALRARVAAGGGRAMLPTLAGEPLLVTLNADTLTIADADGDRAYLTGDEVSRPNGVLHVVDGVVSPTLP